MISLALLLLIGAGPARERLSTPPVSASTISNDTGWYNDGGTVAATLPVNITPGPLSVGLAGINTDGGVFYTSGTGADSDFKISKSTDDLIVARRDGTVYWKYNYSSGQSSTAFGLNAPTYRLGNAASSPLMESGATITSVVACTGPTVTHGFVAEAQYDVGTACTGVTTIVITLPAASNGWGCGGYSKTAGKTILQTADTTTTATMTHYTILGMIAADFADGEDVVIWCKGR